MLKLNPSPAVSVLPIAVVPNLGEFPLGANVGFLGGIYIFKIHAVY